mgnify:CR=1 FL=1
MSARVHSAKERLGKDSLVRAGQDSVTFICASCQSPARLSFITLDGYVAAALQAGMDGIDFADAAGRAFDQARPLLPGDRALDGACATCQARFRIIATGGEQSREGALEYHLHDIVEMEAVHPSDQTNVAVPVRSLTRVRINIVVLSLVIVAAGIAFLIPGLRDEQQRSVLIDRGVTTTARVTDETRQYRSSPSVDVAFTDARGVEHTGTFVVPLVSGWHLGDTTIKVVYDPQSPSHVVAASGGLRHAWGFLLAGAGLIVLGVWVGVRLLSRTRRV